MDTTKKEAAPDVGGLTDAQIEAKFAAAYYPPKEPGNELLQRVYPGDLVKVARSLLATKAAAEAAPGLPAAIPSTKEQAFIDLMPKRAAFIKFLKSRGLDASEDRDAWGQRTFKHSHIEAMWYGWFNAPAQAAPQQAVPRVLGVSRDAESPGGKSVLVALDRAPTDDELRSIHAAFAATPVPPVPAEQPSKAQIIALANANGIDTDTDCDIWGSTNGAIFKFAEALLVAPSPAAAQEGEQGSVRAEPYAYEHDNGTCSELVYVEWFKRGGVMEAGDIYRPLYLSPSAAPSSTEASAQAAPADLRDAALKEAAVMPVPLTLPEIASPDFCNGLNHGIGQYRKAIRALRSTSTAAQAATDAKE